jgi:hypothetical protein
MGDTHLKQMPSMILLPVFYLTSDAFKLMIMSDFLNWEYLLHSWFCSEKKTRFYLCFEVPASSLIKQKIVTLFRDVFLPEIHSYTHTQVPDGQQEKSRVF